MNRYHTAFVDGDDLDWLAHLRSMICVLPCLYHVYSLNSGKRGLLSLPTTAQVDLTSVAYVVIPFLVMALSFEANYSSMLYLPVICP